MTEGREVTIGGQTFTAAPLNFRALEEYGPFIEDQLSKGGITMKDLPTIRKILTASLRRNHPDIGDDFLLDHLDMRNVQEIMLAILEASGARPAGEAKASAVSGGQPKTGANSTSTSSPASPAGPSNTSPST